ncbi:ABC transporter substrate-binding protein [Pseudorhodobacter sp.]|uniref:ABC transporter substrate-binding protein n=1 Tax=Pseudorhodobacter sp. TaxID=1934400 RepID=UPI002AFEDFAA|nr:ABC transporter substrate-binding protein [Pseudorhodobacter sp.]
MRSRARISLVILALAAGFFSPAALADIPQRVVSMNLCTDQLAMLIAAQGQLVSVSRLATDPRSSAMVNEAKGFVQNQGLAEEIYLMHPDLILAGSFTARASVDMLRRLGLRVETFEPAYSLDDVADRITQMGDALGRQDAAAQIVADYRAGLAGFQQQAGRRPRAALFSANGYTANDDTVAGQILIAAGFDNIAAEVGVTDTGVLPLEVLAMAAPEAVITSTPYPGASRSEDIMDHPVITALRAHSTSGSFSDADWVCGTPFVLRAIGSMVELRHSMRTP